MNNQAMNKQATNERAMKKRAVIFDMDGLMFDTQSIYDRAYIEVGRNEYGIEIPDALSRRLRGSGGVNLEESVHAFFPEIDAHAFIRRSFDLTAEKAAVELRIKPGLEDLLDYLQKEKYTLALASGSERALVEANLKKAGMCHLFTASLCGDEVTHGKPDPELYLRVAEMIGFAPQDCYVIEDSVNGIIAGHKAGCIPIMVPDTEQPSEEIRSYCAGVFETLFDVRRAFEMKKA